MTDELREIPSTPLTHDPATIVAYELPTAKRGYDREAVDDLLDKLAAQTQALLAEITALRGDREALHVQLGKASEAETTLKKTLVTAQRAAEAAVQEAREQAEAVRARALVRAEEILQRSVEQAHEMREAALRRARADEAEARRRRRALDDHVDALRAFAEDHRDRVAHHLRQQLERLDAMELPRPPPPPTTALDDEVVDESVLGQQVDSLVAEIVADVGVDESVLPTPPGGAPPSAAAVRAGATPPPAPPTEDEVDLDQLLARVDEAAAEVDEAAGLVGQQQEDEGGR